MQRPNIDPTQCAEYKTLVLFVEFLNSCQYSGQLISSIFVHHYHVGFIKFDNNHGLMFLSSNLADDVVELFIPIISVETGISICYEFHKLMCKTHSRSSFLGVHYEVRKGDLVLSTFFNTLFDHSVKLVRLIFP